MHMPVQRRSFAPHSIIYFGVTVTAPMKTARLCARCWCWLLGFSGSASLDGPGEIMKALCSLLFLFMRSQAPRILEGMQRRFRHASLERIYCINRESA